MKNPASKDPQAELTDTFNWMAKRYISQTMGVSSGWYPSWMGRLVTLVEDFAPTSLVDIGSGPGYFLDKLTQAVPHCELSALDPSPSMLEHVPPNVKRYQGYLEDWAPMHRRQFDAAILSFVLRDMGHYEVAIKLSASVLNSGGHLVVLETQTPEGWQRPFFNAYVHSILPWLGDLYLTRGFHGSREFAPYRYLSTSHHKWQQEAALPNLFKSAGLKNIACHSKRNEVITLWSAKA